MLLLTFLGTLEQVDYGIYDIQQKYFNSVVVSYTLANRVPILLPGGGLLMVLLSLNLLCGGMVRIKKRWSRAGILVVHSGIALLLLSGFITYAFSNEGYLTLYENQQSDKFQSYYIWEICVKETTDDGSVREHIIPGELFESASNEMPVTFHSSELPFAIRVNRYMRNSQALPKGPMFEVDVPVVDGYFLQDTAAAKEAERNVPGAYIQLIEKANSRKHEAILWGLQEYAYAQKIDRRPWAIDLRPKSWTLPFTVVLDKFTRELHPRTTIAKVFSSDITKIEDGISQRIEITMNEPLRHRGYTLFQASWGPSNAKPNDPLYSTFAVVKNPADRFPIAACTIIGVGLLIHFSQKLIRYIRRERGLTAITSVAND